MYNYEIKDNKIILHFKNGKKVIPYTSNNEQKILEKMEDQLQNILDIKDKLDDKLYDLKMHKIGSIGKFIVSIIGILVTLKIYYSMSVIIYLLIPFGITSILFGIDIIVKSDNIIKLQEKITKLEKFEYSLKKQKAINVNNERKKESANFKKDDALTINDMNKLNFKELNVCDNEANNKKVYIKKR